MAFCTNCGKELFDNDKFCPECGAKIEVASEVNNHTNASTDNQPKSTSTQEQVCQPQSAKKKFPWTAVICASIALIAVVVLIIVISNGSTPIEYNRYGIQKTGVNPQVVASLDEIDYALDDVISLIDNLNNSDDLVSAAVNGFSIYSRLSNVYNQLQNFDMDSLNAKDYEYASQTIGCIWDRGYEYFQQLF